MSLKEKRKASGFPSCNYDEKDVKEAVMKVLKRVRTAPNRDDKINAQLLLLDGGGIDKNSVRKIIEEELGWEE